MIDRQTDMSESTTFPKYAVTMKMRQNMETDMDFLLRGRVFLFSFLQGAVIKIINS